MSKVLFNNDTVVPNWRRDFHAVQKYGFIHHFLPRAAENRRAVLLSPKSFVIYCALILLVTGLFRFLPLLFPKILGYATNINIQDLLNETNKTRSAAGVGSLKYSSVLSAAAKKKAEDMFKQGYWAHVAPDGKEPWDFILGENYDYIYAGENLAKNFSSSDDVVTAWYNSPSHKENLLSANYSEVGFAVVNGSLNDYETTLVVQMFGKPRLAAQAVDVEVPDNVAADVKPAVVDSIPAQQESRAPVSLTPGEVKPLMDVRVASRWITLLMGAFVAFLLALDVWYSSKKGIVKIGGHTFVHLSFLILALAGIWFVLVPGSIL